MSNTTRCCLVRESSCGSRPRSSVLAPRLLLTIFFCLLQSSFAAHYYDEDVATSEFNCTEEWCGEEWKENRILKYNYHVVNELVLVENVTVKHVYNCTGQQSSRTCKYEQVVENRTTPVWRKRINRTLESITRLSSLDLQYISTDNIDKDRYLNDTYPLNQDKIWQLRIPKGCRMVIYFSVFDIETSGQCQNDNFSVQIEKQQKNIRRYCNRLQEIQIRKTRVQLWFHSNDKIARKGIRAHICLSSDNKRTDDELPCNCRGDRTRSKRDESTEASQSKSSSKSYRTIKDEKDAWTGEQLKFLQQKSPEEIQELIDETDDANLRYLAILFQQSLDNSTMNQ